MYHSRYHFENDCLHLAIDSLNGQILELADRRTGENLLKNAMFALPQPFTVRLRSNEGETELSPANVRDVHRHPDLRCEVSSCETADGLRVTVRYPCLWDGTTRYPLSLTYTATLCHNTIRWDCTVDNAGNHTVTQVRFPILNGIWLGDTWKDNVLYYPRFAGERYENPTAYLSAEPRIIQWRWQEYCYDYFVDSMWQDPALTARGLHGQALRYAGALSMSWMELDGPGQGFYFGCHDPEAKPCVLEAGAVGETRPGVCLAASFDPRVIPGDRWSTPPVMTRLHDGDWHRGAEYYRAFRAPLLSAPKARPHWMKNSRALFAHYDFKYQNGGVVHTYQDIPALARKAKEQGVCHLLLSGWHEDGFDCGFPQYVPDGDLGSEADLIRGIRSARDMGVHVTLYMNIRIHNRAYEADTIEHKSIMTEDGRIPIETYGDPHLKFSVMCAGSDLWQKEISEAVRRATEVYGVDGIYFDQLAAGVCFCFHPEHQHAFDDWCKGHMTILQQVASRFHETNGGELCLMGEWPCDIYGPLVDLALNQTFLNHHAGGFAELYRYTFPEHGMVDMVYPTQNMAMRPVHVAQSAASIMGRIFCNGSYFWMYDMEEDNTFSRDPRGSAMLAEVLKLSRLREEYLPDGRFCHTEGIVCTDERVCISRFEGESGQLLCIYAYGGGEDVTIYLNTGHTAAVFCDATGTERQLTVQDGMLRIPAQTGLIILGGTI